MPVAHWQHVADAQCLAQERELFDSLDDIIKRAKHEELCERTHSSGQASAHSPGCEPIEHLDLCLLLGNVKQDTARWTCRRSHKTPAFYCAQ